MSSEQSNAQADEALQAEAARLAEEVRQAVTPVVGFLELLASEGGSLPDEQRLRWTASIERRLEPLGALLAEVERECQRSRRSLERSH